MSNNSYGIGGTEVKNDASEAIHEIGQNKTLFIQKLTQDPPVKPKVVPGLQNVEQVFAEFQPEIDAQYEDANGGAVSETLEFRNVGDFTKKGITEQSQFLGNLSIEEKQYLQIVKQLKSNKILKTALTSPEAKEALIKSIQSLIAEIEQAK